MPTPSSASAQSPRISAWRLSRAELAPSRNGTSSGPFSRRICACSRRRFRVRCGAVHRLPPAAGRPDGCWHARHVHASRDRPPAQLARRIDENRTSVDRRVGSPQRNLNLAEVRSELHSRLGPLQVDPDTFFVPQVNAAGAANESAASTDGTVGAGKVAHLPYA
jgi:hypothetical protein